MPRSPPRPPWSARGTAAAAEAPLDTLLVAGGQGIEAAAADPALLDWVRARAGHASRVASVCTGASCSPPPAADGKRAATHWAYCADLARRFPAVRVQADPIFVRDGDVWSSAGVTAGIDLSLALVEQDLGRTLALAVSAASGGVPQTPGGPVAVQCGAGAARRRRPVCRLARLDRRPPRRRSGAGETAGSPA